MFRTVKDALTKAKELIQWCHPDTVLFEDLKRNGKAELGDAGLLWIDRYRIGERLCLSERAFILTDKDASFIQHMIEILRDIYDVMSEYAYHTKPTCSRLSTDRDLLVEKLELLTVYMRLLAEQCNFHYKE